VVHIDDIVAALRAAVDNARRSIAAVRVAGDMIEEIRDQCEALGAHGIVDQMQALRDQVAALERYLAAGVDRGEELIVQTEAVKGPAAGRAALPGGGTVPMAGTASTTGTGLRSGTPVLAGPGGLDRVLAALPVRPNNKGPTSGHLYDETGQPAGVGAVRSSRDPALLADLSLSGRARRSDSMDSHVEAKVAKMMRDGDAPRHSTVVINNSDGPCGWLARQRGEPRFGTTCDELLSDALPAGSSLTVRWRDRGGVARSQVYRGTGRSIRR
jgi:Double-stranded DNA deaminase toxin A